MRVTRIKETRSIDGYIFAIVGVLELKFVFFWVERERAIYKRGDRSIWRFAHNGEYAYGAEEAYDAHQARLVMERTCAASTSP